MPSIDTASGRSAGKSSATRELRAVLVHKDEVVRLALARGHLVELVACKAKQRPLERGQPLSLGKAPVGHAA